MADPNGAPPRPVRRVTNKDYPPNTGVLTFNQAWRNDQDPRYWGVAQVVAPTGELFKVYLTGRNSVTSRGEKCVILSFSLDRQGAEDDLF